jgi:hypothetical protein
MSEKDIGKEINKTEEILRRGHRFMKLQEQVGKPTAYDGHLVPHRGTGRGLLE